MACSLNTGFSVAGSNEPILSCSQKGSLAFCPSVRRLQFSDSRPNEFMGKQLESLDRISFKNWNSRAPWHTTVKAQASVCVSRILRWWEKDSVPNMIEIQSAQELVDTLLNAGDKLVVIDFFSPGCGGCRALHPKICQLAETNPDAVFLKVNHDKLKTMCYCLRIHVIPFFRIYRGAEGKLCSFSCTIATIKKFKDALAKYGADQYGLGPAKGLDKEELLALIAAGELPGSYSLVPTKKEKMEELEFTGLDMSGALSKDENIAGFKERTAFVMA